MRVFSNQVIELRMTQVVIAGAIALLVVILAFILGLKSGASPDNAGSGIAVPADVWVLRLLTVDDNENGRRKAGNFRDQLEQLQGAEVLIHPHPSGGKLDLVVGAWHRNPAENPDRYTDAIALRKQVRGYEGSSGEQLFPDTEFQMLQR